MLSHLILGQKFASKLHKKVHAISHHAHTNKIEVILYLSGKSDLSSVKKKKKNCFGAERDALSPCFHRLLTRRKREMSVNCLGFCGENGGEAKEEGELSPPRKKKRGDGEEDNKEPKAIVGARPRGQNVPLEFRKENRDGIGRPKGDVGRERFVGSSGGLLNGAAKTTKTTEERVYVAYGDARKEPLTVRLFISFRFLARR